MPSKTTEPTVRYESSGGIARIINNRPHKLNAFDAQMELDLATAFAQFDADESAHVAIWFGEGRCFSSGVDVTVFESTPEGQSAARAHRVTRAAMGIYDTSKNWKPVISAVHDYTLGMACYLALLADVRIATADAKYQVTEIPLGLGAGGLFWAIITGLGGGSFADDVCLTGRIFTGEESYAHNIINAVAGAGEHVKVAEEWAARIADMPPLPVRQAVRIRRAYSTDYRKQANLMTEVRPDMRLSWDHAEATSALREHRPHLPWQAR